MKPSYIVDEHHLLLVTVYAHGVKSNPVPVFERFFDRPRRLLPEFDGRVVADAEQKALVCLDPHLQHPERVRMMQALANQRLKDIDDHSIDLETE